MGQNKSICLFDIILKLLKRRRRRHIFHVNDLFSHQCENVFIVIVRRPFLLLIFSFDLPFHTHRIHRLYRTIFFDQFICFCRANRNAGKEMNDDGGVCGDANKCTNVKFIVICVIYTL